MRQDWDVVVIGGGPAGMSAAATAAETGLSTVLLTEETALGGQIYRGLEPANAGSRQLGRILGKSYLDGIGVLERLRASSAEILLNARVWQIRSSEVHYAKQGRASRMRGRTVVIAVGSMERPVPIPGWTLPGVMTVGAAQVVLKQSGEVTAGRTVLVGGGPLLWLYAHQMVSAGARPAAIVLTTPRQGIFADLRSLSRSLFSADILKGLLWMMAIRRAGVEITRSEGRIRIEGKGRAERVRVDVSGEEKIIAADWVLLHEGVIPRVHLPMSAGCIVSWHEKGQYIMPLTDETGRSSVENLWVVGDGASVAGAKTAALDGEIAALSIAEKLRESKSMDFRARRTTLLQARRKELRVRSLLDQIYQPRLVSAWADDETLICRCEDISAGKIKRLLQDGDVDLNQIKSSCRAAMGPCQGHQCGPSMYRLLREHAGPGAGPDKYLRVRPPVIPVSLRELTAKTDPPD